MFVQLRAGTPEEDLLPFLAKKYLGIKLAVGSCKVNAVSVLPLNKD